MAEAQEQRFYRVGGGLVGGVCAGMAERYDVDVIVPRILAVLIALGTFGLGGIVYMVLWLRLPEQAPQTARFPYEVEPEYADAQSSAAQSEASGADAGAAANRAPLPLVARVAAGVCLAALFLIVIVVVPPLIPGTQPWQLWPVAILVIGVFLVIVPMPSQQEMAWHLVGIVVTSCAALALPMSLGIITWRVVPYALGILWFLVAAGTAMLVVGVIKGVGPFMVGGTVCLVAFCLFALLFLSAPGDTSQAMLVFTESGRVLSVP